MGISLLSTFCFCQTQEFKQYFYPDGENISSEGFLVNGKPDGYWKSYYPDGKLKSIGKRTDCKLDSIWQFYDEQGNLQKEITYFEDHKNGLYKEYATFNDTLFLHLAVMFINDQKQGLEQIFSESGCMKKTIPYINNKKEGKGYDYTCDSTILTITIYENNEIISEQAINRTDSLGRKSGLYIDFYPNKAMKTEANYTEGQLNGTYKYYDQHEQLMQTGVYKHDSLVAANSTMLTFDDPVEKKTYYADSTLKSKGVFRDKTPIGIHRNYNQQGIIVSGELYDTLGTLLGNGITLENGDRNGEWHFFYPSGKTESEGFYSNNQKTGLWKFYYPDETIKQTGSFKDGKYNGLWEFYSAIGDIQKREEYSNGLLNGLVVEYDDDGQKICEGMYKNGQQQGFWTIISGDLITKGIYQYGEKTDIWKSSYLSGQKAFKGEYFSNEPHGKHIYFYKNGQIEREEFYNHGKQIKHWNYYTENGNLKYSVYYKNGKETKIVAPAK